MHVVTNWMVAYPHISSSECQCLKNTNKLMKFVFIKYKPIKNQFHMTIIVKLWPMKFVMYRKRKKTNGANGKLRNENRRKNKRE